MNELPTELASAENPTQVRLRRMAAWKARWEEWLEKKSKRTLILATLMTMSGVLLPFGLILFCVWFYAHFACALADILPHLRFSLGGLFLAIVTIQVPIVLLLEFSQDNDALILASALLSIWFYVVYSRLHEAILAAKMARESASNSAPKIG